MGNSAEQGSSGGTPRICGLPASGVPSGLATVTIANRRGVPSKEPSWGGPDADINGYVAAQEYREAHGIARPAL